MQTRLSRLSGIQVRNGDPGTPPLSTVPRITTREAGRYVKANDLYVDRIDAKLCDFTYDPKLPLDVQIGLTQKMKHRMGKLTIHLPGCEIPPQCIRDIANFMAYSYHAHSLECLDLNFEAALPSALSASSFVPLLESLAHLKNLKNLKINMNLSSFNWREKNHEFLTGFAKSVRNLRQLETLSLGFAANNASERALNKFVQSLIHLPELTRLSLDLTASEAIGAHAFGTELSRLREIGSLQVLELTAAYNTAIDDRAMNAICMSWRHLEGLQNLYVNVTGSRCTARSLGDIAGVVDELSDLRSARIVSTAGLTSAQASEIFAAMESMAPVYEVSPTPWGEVRLSDLGDPLCDWAPPFRFGRSRSHAPTRAWRVQQGELIVDVGRPVATARWPVRFGRE